MSPADASEIEKRPSKSVVVPIWVPLITTVAPGRGEFDSASTTVPVICANPVIVVNTINNPINNCFIIA